MWPCRHCNVCLSRKLFYRPASRLRCQLSCPAELRGWGSPQTSAHDTSQAPTIVIRVHIGLYEAFDVSVHVLQSMQAVVLGDTEVLERARGRAPSHMAPPATPPVLRPDKK
jgi:hypothetical protein